MLVIIILGMMVKLFLFEYQYIDYGFYLSRWVAEIQANGYLKALKDPFYNYTPAYMYILVLIAKLDLYPLYAIKIVSVAFEYFLAFFVGRLAYLYWRKDIVMWLAFAFVPLLPTVMLNSSFMSQCDAIYVSFIVGSIYFLFSKRQLMAVVFLGIAFAFKIQTAMILPFYFVYMLRGQIKWYLFLVVPAIYVISIIPVWMVGRPLMDLLTIYLGQAEYNTELVKNFPNFYVWVADLGNTAKLIGLGVVVILTLLAGYWLSKKRYHFTLDLWMRFVFLSAIICPFFLPGMLERYMYLGDVIGVLCIILIGKKYIFPAVGIIFISFYSYVRAIYVFSFSGDAIYPSRPFAIFESLSWQVVSILYVAIILFVLWEFLKALRLSKLIEADE